MQKSPDLTDELDQMRKTVHMADARLIMPDTRDQKKDPKSPIENFADAP